MERLSELLRILPALEFFILTLSIYSKEIASKLIWTATDAENGMVVKKNYQIKHKRVSASPLKDGNFYLMA